MYTTNRDAYREAFYQAWQKHLAKLPVEPMAAQLIDVILMHPEYQHLFEKAFQSQEFSLEDNPFFHMSLHLALRDQIKTNRPQGVKEIYQQLFAKIQNNHEVEHRMMSRLSFCLKEASFKGTMFSEAAYLESLRDLLTLSPRLVY